MDRKEQSSKYYLGIVSEICTDEVSKEYHKVLVDIPGVVTKIEAFPKQSELDEPRVGDQVLLLCLDPTYFSYSIYTKLKETDFIGFRSSGKMINITPEELNLTVYRDESINKHSDDDGKEQKPEPTLSQISLKSNGNIKINTNTNSGKVIINDGKNGGMINVSELRDFMLAVIQSMENDDHGAYLKSRVLGIPPLKGLYETIEDERSQH